MKIVMHYTEELGGSMNPVEQRKRATAVDQLAADVELTYTDLQEKVRLLANNLKYEMDRTRKLEHEQRSYVDGELRTIRHTADERWLDLAETHGRIGRNCLQATEPLRRSFWGRFKHLLFGR